MVLFIFECSAIGLYGRAEWVYLMVMVRSREGLFFCVDLAYGGDFLTNAFTTLEKLSQDINYLAYLTSNHT